MLNCGPYVEHELESHSHHAALDLVLWGHGAPLAWAFAFWGGRFWIFLKRDSDASTYVYAMDATTGALTTALSNTGRTIVGAGVSTCAPVNVN